MVRRAVVRVDIRFDRLNIVVLVPPNSNVAHLVKLTYMIVGSFSKLGISFIIIILMYFKYSFPAPSARYQYMQEVFF